MPSCSLMCSGIKNLPEKGLAEGLGSISTALCPGRSRVSTLHPMGLILPLQGSPGGLFLPGSCRWGEVVASLSLPLCPAPLFPLSGPQALDNTWKALSAGSALLPEPTGVLHTDGWQQAPPDKVIRPSLSSAALSALLPQISLLLLSCRCSSCVGTPRPAWLLAGGPPEAGHQGGGWEGTAPHQGQEEELRVWGLLPLLPSQGPPLRGPTPPVTEEPGALRGSTSHPSLNWTPARGWAPS